MPGKSPTTRAIEGREIAEACPRGRHRLKRAVLPGLLTYLLMVGARYRRQADAVRGDGQAKNTPARDEYLKHLDWSWKLLEELANRLAETFPSREWNATNEVVRRGLGLDENGNVTDREAFNRWLAE